MGGTVGRLMMYDYSDRSGRCGMRLPQTLNALKVSLPQSQAASSGAFALEEET
jgi:hypothetical protein